MQQQNVIIVKSLHKLGAFNLIALDSHIIMEAAEQQVLFWLYLSVRNILILHFKAKCVIFA